VMSDAAREGLLRDSLGADPAVICRGFDAVALWLSGFPEQAAIQSAEAMKIAQTLQPRHPFSLAYALTSATWLHALRRDVASALEQAAATALFATEQGFPSWLSHSLVVQGWAQAEQGDIENGLASIERALRIYAETGAKVWQPWFLWLHAQALSRAGKQDLALETISSALAVARQLGPYWLEAELLRVQGELMLDAESARPAEARIRDARIRFEQSLQISRNQGAKAFELRACSSLGRLAIRQERLRPTVKAELAAQLGWFAEGSDALDLHAGSHGSVPDPRRDHVPARLERSDVFAAIAIDAPTGGRHDVRLDGNIEREQILDAVAMSLADVGVRRAADEDAGAAHANRQFVDQRRQWHRR
jgi:predicted ATPase